MKQRVFVSSVIDGFEAMREAARRGVVSAGGEPVLVNEDQVSTSTSPRNACLDAVDSCDVHLIIVGERGGWKAPSGKLVVEEELERARARKLPVLAFIQDGARDPDATKLISLLSDYVHGYFRKTFSTPSELEKAVQEALLKLGVEMIKPINPESVLEDLKAPRRIRNESSLRFVLAPERDEEILDILRLESPEFQEDVLRIAHDRKVGLLSYSAPKGFTKTDEGILLSQQTPVGVRRSAGDVDLEVRTSGRLVIDAQVSDLHENNRPFGGMIIQEADLDQILRRCFLFGGALFDQLDAHRRFLRFVTGVSLAGVEHRQLVDRPPGNSLSLGNFRQREDPMLSETPRLVTRDDLENPEAEVKRKIALFRRNFSS